MLDERAPSFFSSPRASADLLASVREIQGEAHNLRFGSCLRRVGCLSILRSAIPADGRSAIFSQSIDECPLSLSGRAREMYLSLRAKEETLWLAKLAKSLHEAPADGSSRSISDAIAKPINAITTTELSTVPCGKLRHTTRKLRERDLGRDLEGAKVTLNEYLDRWLETAVKPRVREKTCQDYEGMLPRYIRPCLGARVVEAILFGTTELTTLTTS